MLFITVAAPESERGGIFSDTCVSDGERGRKKEKGGRENRRRGGRERVISTNKQLCSVDLNYSGLSTAENQKNSPTNYTIKLTGAEECLVVQ